jgi:putative Holliday junction resolvase
MKRILALDYGTKRVGVAVSDPTGMLASALPHLDATPVSKLHGILKALVRTHDIGLVLIGLPRNMDGSYGPSAEAARAFGEKLRTVLPVEIRTIDERLSTVQASRLLHEAGHDSRAQKEKIDSASAQVLLQSYLDFNSTPL